ncbi:hypothetical protein BD324DRAFT_405014 [Kockovaella imperatae]|uniref:Uncharacterized protein n=1 Tax=Kockovaella imperatae TaxID=4999 RepID=A0A1Y1UL91_9TREE|nr:hypothetical protein BD324DRAFT_405014 [Kockovaella imperatae]ORX37875.1 hypothetical protein BD324DRAFT_405014 [Kockovaella imperatae]
MSEKPEKDANESMDGIIGLGEIQQHAEELENQLHQEDQPEAVGSIHGDEGVEVEAGHVIGPEEGDTDAQIGLENMVEDSEGFDPDTLANLAALSRIDEVTGEEIVNYLRSQPGLSPLIDQDEEEERGGQDRDETSADDQQSGQDDPQAVGQVQVKRKRKRSVKFSESGDGTEGSDDGEEELRKVDLDGEDGDGDGAFMDPNAIEISRVIDVSNVAFPACAEWRHQCYRRERRKAL